MSVRPVLSVDTSNSRPMLAIGAENGSRFSGSDAPAVVSDEQLSLTTATVIAGPNWEIVANIWLADDTDDV
jgi:hypothetical protein